MLLDNNCQMLRKLSIVLRASLENLSRRSMSLKRLRQKTFREEEMHHCTQITKELKDHHFSSDNIQTEHNNNQSCAKNLHMFYMQRGLWLLQPLPRLPTNCSHQMRGPVTITTPKETIADEDIKQF